MPPSAVFCPYPPLLVDGATGGRVPEAEKLRAACLKAVAGLARSAKVTVVGPAPAPSVQRCVPTARGTLAGFGVVSPGVQPVEDGAPRLPLSLTVGRWLLDRAGVAATLDLVGVPATLPLDECLRLGETLAGTDLLVLGDGSARRGDKPPGGPHPAAADVDRRVAAALAAGDTEALAALDVSKAEELGVTGRAPWQVLAGWARGRDVAAHLCYDDAPFGVGYLVGYWSQSGR